MELKKERLQLYCTALTMFFYSRKKVIDDKIEPNVKETVSEVMKSSKLQDIKKYEGKNNHYFHSYYHKQVNKSIILIIRKTK